MHRALFTWLIFLVFLILLCLRLESRTNWNWFLIFLPIWVYDIVLFTDALFNILIRCKQETTRNLFKNKHYLIIASIFLKLAFQIMLCLKLEHKSLNLQIYHILLPIWILLPLLITDISVTLFKNTY